MLDNAGSRKASIVIVDYGMGNVRSVQCAISRLGYDATIGSDAAQIIECDGLILPGAAKAPDLLKIIATYVIFSKR